MSINFFGFFEIEACAIVAFMETNKILHRSILVGIFALLLIPFLVFNSMFFPFITGKNFVFRIIVEIIFCLWIILISRDKSFLPKRSTLFYAFTAFIVAITLADFLGVDPYRSFWSDFERMEGLIAHLHFFALFLVAGSVFNTKKLWTYFFNSALVVSVVMAFYGIFQLAGVFEIHQGSSRIDGPIGNSAYLAIYMLFHVFLALFLLLRSRERRMQIVYGGVALLNTIIVYYTATRGSILGLIGGLFLTAILIAIFEKERPILKKVSTGVIVAIVAVIVLFFALRNQPFVRNSLVLNRFATISWTEQTTESRFLIWKMAYQGWKERPLFGWGQDNFILVFQKYYDPKMWNQEPWFDRTHNVVLDWLIAGGAFGFLTYISLFVASLFCIWKKKTILSLADKAVLTGLLAAYFCHNLFVFDNLTSYLLFVFVLAYFHFLSLQGSENADEIQTKFGEGLSPNVQSILIPITIIALPILVYFANVPQILANTSLIRAISYENADISKSLDAFKESISYNTFGKPETRTQLLESSSAVAASNSPTPLKQSYLSFIKSEMETQIQEEPLDARYPYFLGQFLDHFGLPALAQKNFMKALSLSPKKQDIVIALAVSLYNAGEKDKAFLTMKQAFDLDPDNETARLIYATLAIYSSKDDIVKDLILNKYHTYLVPDDRIMTAYIKTGQLKKYVALDTAFLTGQMKAGSLSQDELQAINTAHQEFQKKMDAYSKSNQ